MGAPPKAQPLDAFNAAFLERAQKAPAGAARTRLLLAAAEVRALLDPSQKAAAASLIAASVDVASLPLPLACEVHGALAKKFGAAEQASAFKAKALERFPYAQYFGGAVPAKDAAEAPSATPAA